MRAASPSYLTNAASRPNAPRNARLNFNLYGEQYFLSSVWTSESRDGREISKSRVEKEFARQTPGETVGIALRRQ